MNQCRNSCTFYD